MTGHGPLSWISLLCLTGSLLAADSQGVVVKVPTGSTLVLEDGRTIQLLGLAEAKTRSSQQWLEIYALGRLVTLRHELHSGFAEARAMPVLWDRMDVVGLMLIGGHAKLELAGDEPAAALKRWRAYQYQAKRLKLGLWSAPEAQPVVALRPTEIRLLPSVSYSGLVVKEPAIVLPVPTRRAIELAPVPVQRVMPAPVYRQPVTVTRPRMKVG